jgi:hypothetical protein
MDRSGSYVSGGRLQDRAHLSAGVCRQSIDGTKPGLCHEENIS